MPDDASFDGLLTPDRLGWLILLTLPPIYAVPAHFAFDAPLFGALAGLSIGRGAKLFLPYFMPASPAERAATTAETSGEPRPASSSPRADSCCSPPGSLQRASWCHWPPRRSWHSRSSSHSTACCQQSRLRTKPYS